MIDVYFTFIDEGERQVASNDIYYIEVIPKIGETVLIGKSSKLSGYLKKDTVLNNDNVFEYEGGTVINVTHNIIECPNIYKHRIDVFVKKQIKGGKL